MSAPAAITEARLAANRQNAQASTGPRTPEGKQRTRLNGIRHGLTGQTVLMPHEDQKAFERHTRLIVDSYHPATDTERNLAKAIANDQWRLNRARAIEENIFALGLLNNPVELEDADEQTRNALTQAQTFLTDAKQIGLLSLYEGRIHRNLQRNIAELNRLQAERRAAHAAALEDALLLAQQALAEGRAFDPSHDFPAHLGFAFSAPEINRQLDRRNRLQQARALQNPRPAHRKAA